MCYGQYFSETGTSSTIFRFWAPRCSSSGARQKYGVQLMIMVIPHTFGCHLNFNCHLHILVSEGGLEDEGTGWRKRAPLDRKVLMPMWRYAVITYLREAYRAGVLDTDLAHQQLADVLKQQYERWWNMDIKRFRSKKQFLGYAGRYARRPPIAQHRFRQIDGQEVRFLTEDTRTKRTVIIRYTTSEFLATLADHIPDRYRHNIRYFGLLSPRVKSRTHDAVFALLGQERLGKPWRLRWAASMKESFGIDPLLDSSVRECGGRVGSSQLSLVSNPPPRRAHPRAAE